MPICRAGLRSRKGGLKGRTDGSRITQGYILGLSAFGFQCSLSSSLPDTDNPGLKLTAVPGRHPALMN